MKKERSETLLKMNLFMVIVQKFLKIPIQGFFFFFFEGKLSLAHLSSAPKNHVCMY